MRLPRKLITAAAVIMLAASGPAAATAALSTSQATRASTLAAKAVAKQTHGSSARVTRCVRISSVKTLCHAEAHYTSGAKRCTFDVTVTRAGATSRPRTAPSNFVCY
jgi:hypothetical protein